MNEGSRRAVLTAFAANLGIAVAKFVAWTFTGAASMLAEAVATGKPVVVSETFPLFVGWPEWAWYLLHERPVVAGYVGQYDGRSIEELESLDGWNPWLNSARTWQRLADDLTAPAPSEPPLSATSPTLPPPLAPSPAGASGPGLNMRLAKPRSWAASASAVRTHSSSSARACRSCGAALHAARRSALARASSPRARTRSRA